MDASDQSPRARALKVRCCVVGGGPAGMMLGYLLARAGIEVVVLENTATSSGTFAATRSTPRRSS